MVDVLLYLSVTAGSYSGSSGSRFVYFYDDSLGELLYTLEVPSGPQTFTVPLEFTLQGDEEYKTLRMQIDYTGIPSWEPYLMILYDKDQNIILQDFERSSNDNCNALVSGEINGIIYDHRITVCDLADFDAQTVMWSVQNNGDSITWPGFLYQGDDLVMDLMREILEPSITISAQNYIPDPSFETQTLQPPYENVESGELIITSEESPLEGDYVLKHTATGYDSYTGPWHDSESSIMAPAADGETWMFSAYCKSELTDVPIQLYIFGLSGTDAIYDLGNTYVGDEFDQLCTDEWQRFENTITFNNPAITSVAVRLDNDGYGCGPVGQFLDNGTECTEVDEVLCTFSGCTWFSNQSIYWDALELKPLIDGSQTITIEDPWFNPISNQWVADFGLTVTQNSYHPEDIFSQLIDMGVLETVTGFSPEYGAVFYDVSFPPISTLNEIIPNYGYTLYLNTDETQQLIFSGQNTTSDGVDFIVIESPSWYVIYNWCSQPMPVLNAISPYFPNKIESVVSNIPAHHDGTNEQRLTFPWYDDPQFYGDLTTLQPGVAYAIKLTDTITSFNFNDCGSGPMSLNAHCFGPTTYNVDIDDVITLDCTASTGEIILAEWEVLEYEGFLPMPEPETFDPPGADPIPPDTLISTLHIPDGMISATYQFVIYDQSGTESTFDITVNSSWSPPPPPNTPPVAVIDVNTST